MRLPRPCLKKWPSWRPARRLGTQIFEKNYTFVIYGVNVTCNQNKLLTSVKLAVGGGSAAFTFYGATAW